MKTPLYCTELLDRDAYIEPFWNALLECLRWLLKTIYLQYIWASVNLYLE